MKHSILIISTCLLFSACGNNDKEPETDPSLGTPSVMKQDSMATAPAPVPTTDSFSMPAATAAVPAGTVPVAAGTNPPHGQPGHRCDIAVGAPLNSAPAQQAAKPATPAITTTPAAVPATATKTAPGMNPPHGQPGHRCDIAVGAPLNSAPAAAPAPVQVSPAAKPAESAAPAMAAPAGATEEKKP